jgi:AmiR/NasT family two-component response regulator
MRAAMATRAVIDQAIGVVMAQNRCGPDDAFAILRRASQNRNQKLRDLAREMVESVSAGVTGSRAQEKSHR